MNKVTEQLASNKQIFNCEKCGIDLQTNANAVGVKCPKC